MKEKNNNYVLNMIMTKTKKKNTCLFFTKNSLIPLSFDLLQLFGH